MRRRGFTLIELLVVIAIIALLAAILFPVFASVRGKARQVVCLSNMRQIGMSLAMYAQDNDDLYPVAADPADKYASPSLWPASYQPTLQAMPFLQESLTPYVKSADLWHCPSDSGYDLVDTTGSAIVPPARPTAYGKYGTSYFYRTEIALKHEPYSSIVASDSAPSCTEHGLSEVNVLMDSSGSWHGGILGGKRYNVLMGDGHAVNQNVTQFNETWRRVLGTGIGCPGYVPFP